ncbi:hypothetical protein VPH35_094688 [Triticum aestivum]|uniref:Uncharacterized protein n=1 Tax=Triticum turgidum subsp. durum TaxID=4567 RepID=A0A9R1AUI8_TRITD|nr:unnamed protein product [Triticum turgidum subsp. durum]
MSKSGGRTRSTTAAASGRSSSRARRRRVGARPPRPRAGPRARRRLPSPPAQLVGPGPGRVGAAVLAEPLQIPADQAALALGALAAVLPGNDDDPAADGAWEADLHDVLLFLYIQSYKRLVPRPRFHPFAPV